MKWLWLLLLFTPPLWADGLRLSYLDLEAIEPGQYRVALKSQAGQGTLLPDFGDQARLMPLPGQAGGGALVQRWLLEVQGPLVLTRRQQGGQLLVRVKDLGGAERSYRLGPHETSLILAGAPSQLQTALTYLGLGVEHILMGADHLLFVLALVLLVKGGRRLVLTISAFTLAHSLTLALAALGWVQVWLPPMEACIALSILFVALEVRRSQQGQPSLTAQMPWLVAFAFGLLHGLGFAAALGEIGLPAEALVTALLTFNLGVELGQLGFVALLWGLGWLLRPVAMPPWARALPAYGIGGLAAFWVIERVWGFWT